MDKLQRCFVCKDTFSDRHFFYSQLCAKCGDFNYAKRDRTANLEGKTALITGGRVKIGYALALKLLRAGASVILTTRFPRDAATKYSTQQDFHRWEDRLHIYGVDLRNLKSVDFFTQYLLNTYRRLDIIVNNAAQTVRRPPAFYRHLIDLESLDYQELPAEIKPLLSWNLAKRRAESDPAGIRFAVRTVNREQSHQLSARENRQIAEIVPPKYPVSAVNAAQMGEMPLIAADKQESDTFFPPGSYDEQGEQIDLRSFNSWVMKDDEVSITELLEVHIINAIVPFVINSHLKKLMMREPNIDKYIINVSSIEGRFNSANKPWQHPHTNMAKAALNQMTRTCAREYANHGIFMNAVDPGWVSFHDPYPQIEAMRDRGIEPCFDFIDAAARICDPIYTGINQGKNVFGKLFEHYLETDW